MRGNPAPHRVPKRTGIAYLPLHYGKMPRWLFERMVKLAREICCDQSIEFLSLALRKARIGSRERIEALRRLSRGKYILERS